MRLTSHLPLQHRPLTATHRPSSRSVLDRSRSLNSAVATRILETMTARLVPLANFHFQYPLLPF
eukprot:m.133838 g.133838  ORF g.133838 m.133838 type:complete len:64 (-) comp52429_c0_seq4:574-765(-)